MKKINLSSYKIPQKSNVKTQSWQDYALEIIKRFKIEKAYQPIIWKYAKRNKCYLEGKVTFCYEKFGKEGCEDRGKYLISLFRKKLPFKK